MSKKEILRGCALVALLAAGSARAEDSGFYLGAGFGVAEQSAVGFAGTDSSFKLFGGYSFNRFFTAEGGYVDGGTLDDHDGTLRMRVKNDGFFAAAIGRWPLDEYFAPYVKLGYVFYDTHATVSQGTVSVSETTSDENLLYGGGLEFTINEHFRLRLEYEEVDVDDANFRITSLLGSYRF